eukprot:TRINITY_DN31602_c0_g1_i1.p1 TRINITY_DN31602_c0_g1~~TRINITY_DN31602_c0_g1_i1.p1  ORF type:complete len:282 (+),score=37.13 TRINITY_DN31602_c0_g1_i1:43-888(+)
MTRVAPAPTLSSEMEELASAADGRRGSRLSPTNPTVMRVKSVGEMDEDERPNSARSSSSQGSVRSSISAQSGPRMRIVELESDKDRRRFDHAVRKAMKQGDTSFLINVWGLEETIIEYCVRSDFEIVTKLLVGHPELLVEPDQFIPRPGVRFNETSTRNLTKNEYMRAFACYSAVKQELDVQLLFDKLDDAALLQRFKYMPLHLLRNVIREACARERVDFGAKLVYEYMKGNMGQPPSIAFGKHDARASQMFERMKVAAAVLAQQAPPKEIVQGNPCCSVQ